MSNSSFNKSNEDTYEKMLLRRLIANLKTMLLDLDEATVYDNDLVNLLEDLKYQLENTSDITEEKRTLIKAMISEAMEYARDVGKSVDDAEQLLYDITDEELDFAVIRLKLEAMYAELLQAIQSVWPVIFTYRVLCATANLCNKRYYDSALDIHTKLDNVAYEIFRYLTNL